MSAQFEIDYSLILQLTEVEHEYLRFVWPPLKEERGDCSEDSAIIYEVTIQGNCSLVYEQFSLVRCS